LRHSKGETDVREGISFTFAPNLPHLGLLLVFRLRLWAVDEETWEEKLHCGVLRTYFSAIHKA